MENKNAVLLVDDDPALLNAVGEMLRADYEVSSAKSGSDALELLRAGYLPDIILLDIDMPGLNGFETLALLRQMEDMQDVPVIYLTGLKQTENEVKGINTGAADYIIKPFVRESLLARLRFRLLLLRSRMIIRSSTSRARLVISLFSRSDHHSPGSPLTKSPILSATSTTRLSCG